MATKSPKSKPTGRGGARKGAGRKPKPKTVITTEPVTADPFGDKEWLEAKRTEKLMPRMKREGVTTAKPKTLDEEAAERRAAREEPPSAAVFEPPSEPFSPPPKRGRPTEYKAEYAEQAQKLCRLGATDEELADFFDVERVTIWRWSQKHEAFSSALKAGKEAADERVERSLYARAVGYTYDAMKIFMPQGAAAPVYAAYKEHVPPAEGAIKLWLTNRRSEAWRDKREVAHSHTMKAANLTDDELADIARRGGDGIATPPSDPRITH